MNSPTSTPSSSPGNDPRSRGRPAGVKDLAARDPLEHVEPGESQRPISLMLVIFLATLFSWAGYYAHRYGGGYEPLIYNENAYGLAAAKTNAAEKLDPYALGQRVFGNTCARCHQPDGLGLPGQYPPLAGSEWVLAPGPARMIRIVLDAVQGPIPVKGATFDNVMTPWRDTLNDEQIAAVITFVRTQKEWGNTASPVTPEEVAAIRAKTKARSAAGPWTVAELQALPDQEPNP
jgi:mono/diheme cytochrome c family protein